MMNINFVNLLMGKKITRLKFCLSEFFFVFLFLHVLYLMRNHLGHDSLSEFFMCGTREEKVVEMFRVLRIIYSEVHTYICIDGLTLVAFLEKDFRQQALKNCHIVYE